MTVVGFLLAALLSADPAQPAETVDEVRANVEQLIKQLNAATLLDRKRAEHELIELGPKILSWLPPRELVPGASSREAVDRIRTLLQKKLARDSARPSRVTVSGEYELEQLLAEIPRQTANPVELGPDLPESMKKARRWNLEDVTFWEAIDEICRVANLVAGSHPESNALLLTPSPPGQAAPMICRASVLRAEINAAIAQPVTGDPTRTLIRLRGELAFEPRLRPLFVHFQAGDFSAVNDDGDSIPNWNPLARYELPMAGASRRTQLTWDFVAPTDAVPKTLSLKGRVLVQLAATTEPIRFDQLTTNKEILRRRGGVSVRMHHADFTETDSGRESAQVKITVSYDAGGPAFESHRTWVYHNAAWLEDGKKRYPFADFDTLLQTDGSVQLEYRFQDLPQGVPLKFVYEAPTLLLDVPFDVGFSNVEVEESK